MNKLNLKHVVIAWEFGAGFGHFALINGLLNKLLQKQYQITLVVQNIDLFADIDFENVAIYQAPISKLTNIQLDYQSNYSDILYGLSYSDAKTLSLKIYAWECLLSLLKPNLLICNYAPTAIIAAHGFDFPISNFSTGFGVPLLLSPLPALRSWVPESKQVLKESDDRLLVAINNACELLGKKAYSSIPHALKATDNVLATFPELDPYIGRGDMPYWGALFSGISQNEVLWENNYSSRVIVYLKKDLPKTNFIFNALVEKNCEVLAYFGDGKAPDFLDDSFNNIKVLNEGMNLEVLLMNANCVICSAGHGLVANSLLSGVPMMLMPTNLEQKINAESVKSLNAGLEIVISDTQTSINKKLDQILHDEVYKKGAQSFQLKYKNYQCDNQFEAIAEHYDNLLME